MVNIIKFLKPIIEKNKITFPIEFCGEPVNIINEYLCKDEIKITDNIEGIMSAYIPIAICNNLPIVSEVPIDRIFYNNIQQLPEIYYKYSPAKKYNGGLFSLNIDAPIIDKKSTINSYKCATAISGGVDSVYTLIKNREDITDLFYVIGFDIEIRKDNMDWIDKVVSCNEKIATLFNKKYTVCRSNLLSHIKTLVAKNYYGSGWADYTVGGGICSIIYPLNFSKLYISGDGVGNHTPDHMYGKLYEHLYSSNVLNVYHYDMKTRWEKIYEIYQYNISLLEHLRFCIKHNNKKGLNCGQCNKCHRTYLMMYLLGLNKYITIKSINDKNYLKIANEFIKNSPNTFCFVDQLKILLKNYNPKKEITII